MDRAARRAAAHQAAQAVQAAWVTPTATTATTATTAKVAAWPMPTGGDLIEFAGMAFSHDIKAAVIAAADNHREWARLIAYHAARSEAGYWAAVQSAAQGVDVAAAMAAESAACAEAEAREAARLIEAEAREAAREASKANEARTAEIFAAAKSAGYDARQNRNMWQVAENAAVVAGMVAAGSYTETEILQAIEASTRLENLSHGGGYSRCN